MNRTIDIFISYAHEDRKLREQLEEHLKLLKRESTVNTWHDQNIIAGVEAKPLIATHLDAADIILLLMSSHFISSDSCYEVEMRQALERHKAGKAHVVLVILRPVDWKETPVRDLPVLPTNGKPITTWRDRDEAFSSVVKEIHEIVKELGREQLKEESLHPLLELAETPLNSSTTENDINTLASKLLASSQLAVETEESILKSISSIRGEQRFLARKKLWQSFLHLSRRKAFKLLAGLTITGAGVSLLGWIGTQALFGKTASTNTPSQSVRDQNLSVQFTGTQQSAIRLPDNPVRLSPGQLPREEVPALCINQQEQQSVFRIIIGLSNLRQDQYVLLIEQVQIIVEQITFIPRPLYALVQSLPTLSNYNLYSAIYMGQDPHTSILAKYDYPPYDYVFLTLNEMDKISVQVASSVEVFLSFRVAITYQVADEEQTHTLMLPNPFQVIFSDKSNWHPYQRMQDGHFTQLDTP